jgi:hypothetical protein
VIDEDTIILTIVVVIVLFATIFALAPDWPRKP